MAENNIINDIIKYNKVFVSKKGYKDYVTSKYPDKKIAVISCMDTRLTELLPAALGARNGDIKIIKNAGGVISNPFGSVVRSVLIPDDVHVGGFVMDSTTGELKEIVID